jgi:hypothetical protein
MEGLNSKCTQSFFSRFLGPHIGPNKVTSLEWGQCCFIKRKEHEMRDWV